jgi:hypothetical protein
MAGKLAQILATKADLTGGVIPTAQIPTNTIFESKLVGVNRIILSPTPPTNQQVGDIWINSSET